MEWGNRMQRIYETLSKNGQGHLVKEIIEELATSGTPCEAFSIACVWLARKRNHDRKIYSLIKEDGDLILIEGLSIGYFNEEYYKNL